VTPIRIDDKAWTVAQRVCTEAELEAYRLERLGLSQRAIAYHLGVSREAVRDRLERAARKIAAVLEGSS
jgi:predicted DNA-binding protein (UPF0251 family)